MVNRSSILLYLYYSGWVNILKIVNLLCLTNLFFMGMLYSGMLYDLNAIPTSKLKFMSCLYLSSASQVNVGSFIMGVPILGPAFCVPSCLVLFYAPAVAMACTAALATSATACTISSTILSAQLLSCVFVFFCFLNCLSLLIWDFYL